MLQLGASQTVLFQFSAMFAKTAILALYRRIFSPVRLANILIFSGITFTIVSYVAIAIGLGVGLAPRSNDHVPGGELSAQYSERAVRFSTPLSAACGVIGAIIDIYVVIVPLFFIWHLHTPMKRKVGLSAILVASFA